MDQETQRFDLTELFISLPTIVYSSYNGEDTTPSPTDDKLQSLKTEEFVAMELKKRLIESILQDDKALLMSESKRLFRSSSKREDVEGDENRDSPELLDRSIVSKLLQMCCMFDSMECATALINGELGAVPLVNEIDEIGRSALHTAAEMHAARCVELLLRKRARTDLKTKDGRAQIALELSLCRTTLHLFWTPDDSIEDLLIRLSARDLTAVKLLTEKTKETGEVAYEIAMEGRVISLAALLMVAAEKVNSSPVSVLRTDADLGSKEKTTVYECVIKEALSLGRPATSSRAAKRTGGLTKTENAERRKLLLCEMELLQLFGAVAHSGCTDRKVTSPLIRASQALDEAVIALLLKTNVDVNDADAEGNSALHWCLKTSRGWCPQQIRIVWLLLKNGARVSQRNKLGLTALHIAAANGNTRALQILLLEGPDSVNSTTEMKETPLFFAVKNDFMDCAQLLLRWGANSEVLNLRRQRPIDLAKSQDMRFMLSPTNVSLTNRVFPIQQKYTAWLHNDEVISETCEALLTMTDEGTTTERICLSPKTEICRYFESPSGCVRGAKCFYAHGEEEIWRTKQGKYLPHSPVREELKRKIFVGGLPNSLDSDSLGKFFEEQFGSVEDAKVVGSEMGNQMQSRGFGFITFKQEKSVSAAVQAHYVAIMGKQVEIKRAVPRCLLVTEYQKLPPQQQESQLQPQALRPNEKNTDEARPEQMTLRGEKRTCSNEPQAHVSTTSLDQSIPAWVSTFQKWLPGFLHEVSKRLREGEWYPLSSLKGDFRATCGLELDHASLGYPKLSDFMRSFPGLCRMKVVPIGGHGPATHMVLQPNLLRPHQQLLQSITMPYASSCATPRNDISDCDSEGFKFLQNLPSVSYDDVGFIESDFEEGNTSDEVPEVNPAQKDTMHRVHPRFLEFLKPDPLFHARPWLSNDSDGGLGDADVERGVRVWDRWKKPRQQPRHWVLEALAGKRNNTSFFLREFDFHENYKASVAQGKCFACNQRKMVWANFPCQHLLWCGDCKLHATRAAGTYNHKCVVCDAKVEKIDLIPWNEKHQHIFDDVSNVDDEFPPFDPDYIRSPCKKKKSPLLGY